MGEGLSQTRGGELNRSPQGSNSGKGYVYVQCENFRRRVKVYCKQGEGQLARRWTMLKVSCIDELNVTEG